MPGSEYKESCACGAAIEISMADVAVMVLNEMIATFRNTHKHMEPKDPTPNPVSTVAKGDFGYVRYAAGYEGDDDDD